MLNDLLARAREQAERSKPPVRAAALLRLARVQTAFDRALARKTFDQGLDETRRLTGREDAFLLEQARLLAAAVAPDLLREIPDSDDAPREFVSERLARTMLDHDHLDAAYEYVMHYDDPSSFPFGAVSALMQRFAGEERRIALLRRGIEAWRASPDQHAAYRFLPMFQWGWKALPAEEARETAREIVRLALSRPDWPITAMYDPEQTVRITSGQQHTLFSILHILRHLDSPLVQSLIGQHAQLAAAAQRFPNGMESVMEEAENRRRAAAGASRSGGYGMVGSPRDFAYMKALLQASQDGDFGPAIEHALEQYERDTAAGNPNQALQEFWPSTSRFRSILYNAGKRLGPDGAVYLDRIPDDDLRLFAQIELAAALAGLPELQGVQREYHPGPRGPLDRARRSVPRDSGASSIPPGVRCPKCAWSPRAEDRWSCKCGYSWNTFRTRGLCPGCRYQWETTACLQCGELSAHADWYAQR